MKYFLMTALISTFLSDICFAANHFWFGKLLTSSQSEARWGKEEFNIERFKKGDPSERAKMSASLVKNKKLWVGKKIKEIREQFGSHDGFYFTDWIPAYLIQVGRSQKEETWQVVFLPDNEYNVKDIVIHKNCCD